MGVSPKALRCCGSFVFFQSTTNVYLTPDYCCLAFFTPHTPPLTEVFSAHHNRLALLIQIMWKVLRWDAVDCRSLSILCQILRSFVGDHPDISPAVVSRREESAQIRLGHRQRACRRSDFHQAASGVRHEAAASVFTMSTV